jgi:hypothetical protein
VRRLVAAASGSCGRRWQGKAPATLEGCGGGEGQNYLAGKLLKGGAHLLGGGCGGGGSDSDGFGGALATGHAREAREVGVALDVLLARKKGVWGENFGSAVTGTF